MYFSVTAKKVNAKRKIDDFSGVLQKNISPPSLDAIEIAKIPSPP
jgi:hypothetical protein